MKNTLGTFLFLLSFITSSQEVAAQQGARLPPEFQGQGFRLVNVQEVPSYQIHGVANLAEDQIDALGNLRCRRFHTSVPSVLGNQTEYINAILTLTRRLGPRDCAGELFDHHILPLASKLQEIPLQKICSDHNGAIQGFIIACGKEKLKKEREDPEHQANAALKLEQIYQYYQVYARRLARISPFTYRKTPDGKIYQDKNPIWDQRWDLFSERFENYLERPDIKAALKNLKKEKGAEFENTKAFQLVDNIQNFTHELKIAAEIAHHENSYAIPIVARHESMNQESNLSEARSSESPPPTRERDFLFNHHFSEIENSYNAPIRNSSNFLRDGRNPLVDHSNYIPFEKGFDERGPLLPSIVNIVAAHRYLGAIKSGEVDDYFRRLAGALREKNVNISVRELKRIKKDELYAEYPELAPDFFRGRHRDPSLALRAQEELHTQLNEIARHSKLDIGWALTGVDLTSPNSDHAAIVKQLYITDFRSPEGEEEQRRKALGQLLGIQNAFLQAQNVGFDSLDLQIRNPDLAELQSYEALVQGSFDFLPGQREAALQLLRICDKYYEEQFRENLKTGAILVGSGVAIGTGFGALAAGILGGSTALTVGLLGTSIATGVSVSGSYYHQTATRHAHVRELFKNELALYSELSQAKSEREEARVYLVLDVVSSAIGAGGGVARLARQSQRSANTLMGISYLADGADVAIAGANIYYQNWVGLAIQAGARGLIHTPQLMARTQQDISPTQTSSVEVSPQTGQVVLSPRQQANFNFLRTEQQTRLAQLELRGDITQTLHQSLRNNHTELYVEIPLSLVGNRNPQQVLSELSAQGFRGLRINESTGQIEQSILQKLSDILPALRSKIYQDRTNALAHKIHTHFNGEQDLDLKHIFHMNQLQVTSRRTGEVLEISLDEITDQILFWNQRIPRNSPLQDSLIRESALNTEIIANVRRNSLLPENERLSLARQVLNREGLREELSDEEIQILTRTRYNQSDLTALEHHFSFDEIRLILLNGIISDTPSTAPLIDLSRTSAQRARATGSDFSPDTNTTAPLPVDSLISSQINPLVRIEAAELTQLIQHQFISGQAPLDLYEAIRIQNLARRTGALQTLSSSSSDIIAHQDIYLRYFQRAHPELFVNSSGEEITRQIEIQFSRVGQGTFGEVIRVWPIIDGRDYQELSIASKYFSRTNNYNDALKELEALGASKNLNIFIRRQGPTLPRIVSYEYANGGNMRDYINTSNISPDETLQVLASSAKQLRILGDNNMILTDFKFANVLVFRPADGGPAYVRLGDPSSLVRIDDFNLRRPPLSEIEHSPRYAAPEFDGQNSLTPESLSYMFSASVLADLLHIDPQLPTRELSRQITNNNRFPALNELLMRGIDPNPSQRPSLQEIEGALMLHLNQNNP